MAEPGLRIMHVVGTSVGGDWFVDQVVTLRNRGHDVSAVTPDEGPLTDRLREHGIPTSVVRFKGGRLRDVPRVLLAVLLLIRQIRRRRPQVFHTHLFKAIVVGRIAGFVGHVPLRVSQWPGTVHFDVPVARALDRLTMPLDHVVLGSCHDTVRRYTGLRTGASVAVAHYGLNTQPWDPKASWIQEAGREVRSELGVGERAPLVGMVAHMYPTRLAQFSEIGVKGHEVFIDAAAALATRMPEARFVIVGDEFIGDGSYRRSLEERVRRLGIADRLRFLGHRADVQRLTAALDVLVVPSLAESACAAAVQAALLERPVVASRVGGLPDSVLDGETGFLVEPGNALAFSAAVERLLRDPDLRSTMGARGRRHALATFDLEHTVAVIEDIYRRFAVRHPR